MKSSKSRAEYAQAATFSIANKVLSLCLVALLSACTVTQSTRSSAAYERLSIEQTDSIALLPIANFTDVPQAGLRAEALVESTLRGKGVRQLQVYPPALNPETLFEPSERKAQVEAEKWARAQNMRYAVSGAVQEWRYKVGVDGEPAVGMTIQVKDLKTNLVVYSASGGKSGWSREALSAVAQKLTTELLGGVNMAVFSASIPAAASSPEVKK